eukprot:scaffold294459_cov33-Tisochrysis_lutea.AAC.3
MNSSPAASRSSPCRTHVPSTRAPRRVSDNHTKPGAGDWACGLATDEAGIARSPPLTRGCILRDFQIALRARVISSCRAIPRAYKVVGMFGRVRRASERAPTVAAAEAKAPNSDSNRAEPVASPHL